MRDETGTRPSPARPRPDAVIPSVRHAFAALLAFHGVAHLVGTQDAWQRAADGRPAEYVAGLWMLSDPALLRIVGAVWAVAAIAYVVSAAALVARVQWARTLIIASASLSMALTMAALWASWIGVVINVAVLVAVAKLPAAHTDAPGQ